MQGEKEIPDRYKDARDSWKNLHPDWTLHVWDEVQCKEMAKGTIWEQAIALCDSMIQRADIYRGMVLERYGGVYADIDCYALESFSTLQSVAPGKIQVGGTSFRPGFPVSNAILLSPAKSPFWSTYFVPFAMRAFYTSTAVDEISNAYTVMRTTGPGLWTQLLHHKKAGSFLHVHPPRFFYALDVPKTMLLSEEDKLTLRGCYSFHMQDTSWLEGHEKWIAQIFSSQSSLVPTFLAICAVVIFMYSKCLCAWSKSKLCKRPS